MPVIRVLVSSMLVLTPRELGLVSTTFSWAWGVGLMGGVGVGVVTYLHCVVSGSDHMRWKSSRWARSISSSFSRVVSIFFLAFCLGVLELGFLEREFQEFIYVRGELLQIDSEIESMGLGAWGPACLRRSLHMEIRGSHGFYTIVPRS